MARLLAVWVAATVACAPPPIVTRPQAAPSGVPTAEPDASRDAAAAALGVFEGHADVGTVLHPGSVEYDPSAGSYQVTGSGENMWFAKDAFQFAWKKVSGDVALEADVSFVGQGGNEHRKAALVIRQSLDPDSVYADVALHGSGLTSLQYRDAAGADTHEIQSNVSAPKRLRIEKRGSTVSIALAGDDHALHAAGASIRVPLDGPFFVGIGVCAHDKDAVERAVFSNVELAAGTSEIAGRPAFSSSLETVAIASTDRRVVLVTPERIEAPNWTRDGATLLFNEGGRIRRIPASGGEPATIDTGFAVHCNNDHGVSPDGKWLVISDDSEQHRSNVYIVPSAGGTPRRITRDSPSYWHGWSPDGKTLLFVGQRNGNFDVYAIAAAGGREVRLTAAEGLDDGPDYSPDGRYVYFNSERTGTMQIWRMRPDGSGQEQVLSDEYNDWFPHVSPDGKWMVFLSYDKAVSGHPADKDVILRLMSMSDSKVSVLARLVGGQGTINVPSWSPDSLKVAFVSYQLPP